MKSFLFALQFGWPYLRPYRERLILGVVLGAFYGVSNALFVWAMKLLFERLSPAPGTEPVAAAVPAAAVGLFQQASIWASGLTAALFPRLGESMTPWQVAGILLILPTLAFLRGGLGYASSYFMKWVSERMLNDMRFSMVQKLHSLSLDYFVKSRTGDLIKRVNQDTDAVYYFINLGLSDLIREPITLIGIMVSLAIIDWQLLLAALLVFPALVAPTRILGRKVGNAARGKNKTQIRFSSLLVEMIANIRMIKSFALEHRMEQRFSQFRREIVGFNMRMARSTEMINPLVEVAAALGLGIILFFVFRTHREVGDLVGFLTGFALAASPLKKLTKVHLYVQNARVSIERIQETVNEQPTVKPPQRPFTLSGFRKALTFDDVSFAYGDIPVLQNLSLEIPKGTALGIAGESGSGKSTFVNLLFRFYDPTSGCVRIDGTDLRDVNEPDLRRLMALVSQEVLLFDDTVAANIALGRHGATEDEIISAAKAAHAHEFIHALPEGYATRIGERGVTLSGGQRQRLSIARAFIRNAPILVLDEATAALDSESEAEVQKAVDELAENRTVVMIAHRLSTLRRCGQVIVLSRGRMVESGGFEELLARGRTFASMAARQGILFPTPDQSS